MTDLLLKFFDRFLEKRIPFIIYIPSGTVLRWQGRRDIPLTGFKFIFSPPLSMFEMMVLVHLAYYGDIPIAKKMLKLHLPVAEKISMDLLKVLTEMYPERYEWKIFTNFKPFWEVDEL